MPKAQITKVVHTIEPVFNEHSRVLLLGTMPSPKSREVGFYYGHPQNRFWKVLAILFDEPIPETIEEKRDLCLRHNIALWDVLSSCTIKGASDASITDAQPNDLSQILQKAPIEALFTTGTKAGQLYHKLCEPSIKIPCTVLPSTSPANSRVSLSKLCEIYQEALSDYLVFKPTYPVLDVSEVVSLEQTIAAKGTSLYTLMHRAGRFLAYETEKVIAHLNTTNEDSHSSTRKTPSKLSCDTNTNTTTQNFCLDTVSKKSSVRIALVCGHGNNGGDGWVAADYLARKGYKVDLISSLAPEDIKAESARTTAIELKEDLSTRSNVELLLVPSHKEVKNSLSQADLIIDALLGTGFSGDTLREPFATWVELINQQGVPVISADVASGFSAQTGKAATPCIKASHTVTMITLKTGLACQDAQTYCGTIRVAPLADISFLEKQ